MIHTSFFSSIRLQTVFTANLHLQSWEDRNKDKGEQDRVNIVKEWQLRLHWFRDWFILTKRLRDIDREIMRDSDWVYNIWLKVDAVWGGHGHLSLVLSGPRMFVCYKGQNHDPQGLMLGSSVQSLIYSGVSVWLSPVTGVTRHTSLCCCH